MVSCILLPLEIVMLILGAVAIFPAASRATAERVWEPFDAVVEFKAIAKRVEVSWGPRLLASSLNWPPTTPTLSEALAETVTAVPETVAPLAGALMETTGGVLSAIGLLTVTVILLAVARFPAASRTIAERV